MHFVSVRWGFEAQPAQYPCVVLERGRSWDDFGYRTLFTAYWFDAPGPAVVELGRVKILEPPFQPLTPGQKHQTELPDSFETLPDTYCSLGQDYGYYEGLAERGPRVVKEVLGALQDLASSSARRAAFRRAPGVEESLLRSPEARRLLSEAPSVLKRRSAVKPRQSAAARPAFRFRYHPPEPLLGFTAPHDLTFDFAPAAAGLGRAIALVGANGTGKTATLGALARALSGLSPRTRQRELSGRSNMIGSVIAVSFSAFDTFVRPRQESGVPYTYVGLRTRADQLRQNYAFEDMDRHLKEIEREEGWDAWVACLRRVGVPDETPTGDADLADRPALINWLRKLSSGHKIAVFILAALMARLRPRALVLLDEPDLYLHPTLLARLMRELHELLEQRQAFAIIATHSPMVVQSIPAAFVHVIRREGGVPFVQPYPGETFGENLSEIVNRVFDIGESERNDVQLMRAALLELQSAAKVRKLLKPLSLNASLMLGALERERKRR